MMRALHARRDPAWTADGFVSERWHPVSPVTGRLDAFEWKDPLAGDDLAGALIEAQKTGVEETGRLPAPGEAAPSSPSASRGEIARRSPDFDPMADGSFEGPSRPASTGGEEAVSSQEASPRLLRRSPLPASTRPPIPVAPAVIPLVHAPDDPGPEPQAQNETGPQSGDEPTADNWTRIRHLFRP
jgi:HemY protein